MTTSDRQARIDELDRLIGAATCWGAYIAALDEERRGLMSAQQREG